jgi:hypothetical protein
VTDVPNPMLRAHAVGGFSLTLGVTHIAALVVVDATIQRRDGSLNEAMAAHRTGGDPWAESKMPQGTPWNHFVPGIRGVLGRGLLEETAAWRQHKLRHPIPQGDPAYYGFPRWRYYRFTAAGKAARALLVESGVWQEWATELARHQGRESVA